TERPRRLDAERASSEPLRERAAREEGHDEERRHLRRPGVEERHEAVLRRERGEEAPLPLEALEALRVAAAEDLERDLAALGRARAVDDARAAAADLFEHFVGAEPHAGRDDDRAARGVPGASGLVVLRDRRDGRDGDALARRREELLRERELPHVRLLAL